MHRPRGAGNSRSCRHIRGRAFVLFDRNDGFASLLFGLPSLSASCLVDPLCRDEPYLFRGALACLSSHVLYSPADQQLHSVCTQATLHSSRRQRKVKPWRESVACLADTSSAFGGHHPALLDPLAAHVCDAAVPEDRRPVLGAEGTGAQADYHNRGARQGLRRRPPPGGRSGRGADSLLASDEITQLFG